MLPENILITGANGRVGQVLVKALEGQTHVLKLDIVGEESETLRFADISSLEQLQTAFSFFGKIDAVIHLAADHRVDGTWESVLQNNIIGTRNIYECCHLYDVKRVVYASSSHTTGAYEGLPRVLHLQENPPEIKTTDPVRPNNYYGVSKVFGEAIARQYYELYGIVSACLRIGTVIADDDPRSHPRLMRTWVSHRDFVQIVTKALIADIGYGVYYAVSGNRGRFWDITNAQEELDYQPQDDASQLPPLL